MKELSKKDYKLLYNLMSINELDTYKYVFNEITKYYKDIFTSPFYIMAEGNIPIVLLAHLDTVDEGKTRYDMLYDKDKNILSSLYSLGFDDKAGIAAILKILSYGYRPSVIFCTGEENGCVGSSQLIKDYPQCPFKSEPKYMIQIDRRGTNDCVFYDDGNEDFVKYIESFGYYKKAFGSYTDIAEIAPIWEISAVNLSTGYFNEHTRDEYLLVPAWYETIHQVKTLLNSIEKAPYFKYVETYSILTEYEMTGYDDWYSELTDYCDSCHKEFLMQDLIDVTMKDGTSGLFCGDCLSDKGELCTVCNNFYELDNNVPESNIYCICPKCRGGKRVRY